LKKKSNTICCHELRELVAVDKFLMWHIKTVDDAADLATNMVANGQK